MRSRFGLKCMKCGSENMEAGHATGGLGGPVMFRPRNTKFWTLKPAVELEAYICLDCGRLEFYGDTLGAKRITDKECD
ncbi:MAG: hypothetical protein HN742_19730 [Lentisphaerae bacterium]|nr:hypothetical protein [Lentisphaerota bacterium]MBT5604668.1 hypothetical protein [Lentisphaerota bacterium]MBT7056868.1 hypothetical protein [Lentisphaerota bacterium]MBT7844121.1 hypothetical protein [Lentisphaerota bacterium]